jgi:hypothetical protein
MRLWTVHPKYLDAQGLVALWREALLAQKVLRGATKGYRHHPQLRRFQAQPQPVAALAAYLKAVHVEATRRGYRFDGRKIVADRARGKIPETSGQLLYEWEHLRRKLKLRAPELHRQFREIKTPDAHSLFRITPGTVRDWEKV